MLWDVCLAVLLTATLSERWRLAEGARRRCLALVTGCLGVHVARRMEVRGVGMGVAARLRRGNWVGSRLARLQAKTVCLLLSDFARVTPVLLWVCLRLGTYGCSYSWLFCFSAGSGARKCTASGEGCTALVSTASSPKSLAPYS